MATDRKLTVLAGRLSQRRGVNAVTAMGNVWADNNGVLAVDHRVRRNGWRCTVANDITVEGLMARCQPCASSARQQSEPPYCDSRDASLRAIAFPASLHGIVRCRFHCRAGQTINSSSMVVRHHLGRLAVTHVATGLRWSTTAMP